MLTYRYRLLPLGFVLLSFIAMTTPATAADEAADRADDRRWAIAVHGGAGGDPAAWSEQRRQARRDGMRAALQTGRDLLADGADALDVVEQVIRILEDDAHFNAGRGAVLTSAGRAELDASIMDGRNGQCGAVGAVATVKNPITLARRVMTETPHVLLVGAGADAFARQQQVEQVAPEYFLSWRQSEPQRERDAERDVERNAEHNVNRNVERDVERDAERDVASSGDEPPYLGTVGCVVLDQHGNLAAGTSTGGLAQKRPGRIGDSPIIGAGTYAANDTCAVSGTGVGEEFIRHAVAYDVAAQMRYAGRTLPEAVDRVIDETLQPGVGGLIAVGSDGTIVLRHNTPAMTCGAADSRGRFDVYLQKRGRG